MKSASRSVSRLVALAVAGIAVALTATPVSAADPGTQPGSVVRIDALPEVARVPDAIDNQRRLTYWTEGATGTPALSTGAVYLPQGQAPEGGWPVLSFAHGTEGVGDDCAPSFASRSEVARNYLQAWLDAGFAIVATDYVGLGTEGIHPYLHGRSEGRAVIDMVRAARSVEPSLSEHWIAAGHSQGGHASMFAAHEATSYAPELDYRGGIATGTPANLEELLPLGGPYFPDLPLNGLTAFSAYIIDGMRVFRPDLPIDDHLTPAGKELITKSETMCFRPFLKETTAVGVADMLSKTLYTPEIRSAIRDYLSVPTSGYDRPLFIGHGVPDVTVPFPLGAKLAADLALNRQNVTVRVYSGAHELSAAQSTPDVVAFGKALMGPERVAGPGGS